MIVYIDIFMDNQFDNQNIDLDDPEIEYWSSPLDIDKSTGFTRLQKLILYNHKVNQYDNIKTLIKTHPELVNQPNTRGWTALMIACTNSRKCKTLDIIKLLLECPGIDVNAQQCTGWTALMLAVRNSNRYSTDETVELLLNDSRGLNVNLQTTDKEWSCLMFAASNDIWDRELKTMGILLKHVEYDFDVGLRDSDGKSVLIIAVENIIEHCRFQRVKLLLGYKGTAQLDINLVDNCGKTALDYGIKNRDTEIVDLLYQYGASLAHSKYTIELLQNMGLYDIVEIVKSYDVPTKGVYL